MNKFFIKINTIIIIFVYLFSISDNIREFASIFDFFIAIFFMFWAAQISHV